MEPPCDQLFPRTSELKLKRSRLSESRCCRCVTMFVHNKRGTASTESWKWNEAARKWEVEKLRVSQPGSHRFSLCACVAIVVYVLHSLLSSMAMKPVYDYKHTATSTTTTTTRISKVITNSKKAFSRWKPFRYLCRRLSSAEMNYWLGNKISLFGRAILVALEVFLSDI